jgi:hypothetical protein
MLIPIFTDLRNTASYRLMLTQSNGVYRHVSAGSGLFLSHIVI